MNKKEIYLSFILFSLAFVILLVTLYRYRPISPPPPVLFVPSITPTPSPSPVVILSPDLSLPIKSPQKIVGLIEKSWVFEASFPVQLFENQEKQLYEGLALAPNWLENTDKYTEFSVTLNFSTKASNGLIIIRNDNPSGLEQNNKSFIFPVIFVKP